MLIFRRSKLYCYSIWYRQSLWAVVYCTGWERRNTILASWGWALYCSKHVEVFSVIHILQNKEIVHQVGNKNKSQYNQVQSSSPPIYEHCFTACVINSAPAVHKHCYTACVISSAPPVPKHSYTVCVINSAPPVHKHCYTVCVTQWRTTFGRTSLDERSGLRRDLYLTIHNALKRKTYITPAGFEPPTPASEPSQTHAVDRAVTGADVSELYWLWLYSL
jgi:hypothetical protein